MPQEAICELVARQEAEAVQQDAQQPAGTNEEGGLRIDARGGGATKDDTRRRRRDKRRCRNQPANSKLDASFTSLIHLS